MIGRNQGVAIVINLFFGTIVNAAYGVANQINGVLNYFSTTFQRAINPQLMQSEGMKNRERLIDMSYTSSKFSLLVLALFAVPLIVEMPYVLKIWLHDVPDFTIEFSRLILLLSIIFQLSMGLMSAIQAVGEIKTYFISISCLVLLNIPISYFFFSVGLPAYWSVISFIVIELISFCVRIYFAKKLVGISPRKFMDEVLLKSIYCISSALVLPIVFHILLPESFIRLLLVCLMYALV